MELKGIVKLEIEIAASGKVTSVKPLGGHPVRVDCAGAAAKNWQFEPARPPWDRLQSTFTRLRLRPTAARLRPDTSRGFYEGCEVLPFRQLRLGTFLLCGHRLSRWNAVETRTSAVVAS
jgi:hypothetical protein